MLLNLKKREGQFVGIVVNANLPIISSQQCARLQHRSFLTDLFTAGL